jgi:chromosome segregation ATPase
MKTLIAKIEEAKIKTGLSNPELSIKLGHSRKYLTNLVNDVCTTELQKQLIEELDQVIAGTFKTDAEVIAELTEKLSDAQDLANERLLESEKKMKELRETNVENAKSIRNLTNEMNGYINANIELNAELNTMRKTVQKLDSNLEYAVKTAQDDANRILELKSINDTIDSENDQLREAVSKYKSKVKELNILNWLGVILIGVLSYLLWVK